ncbi:hypothetical protein Dxin01_02762 [Deinococcus xinjiangensis]|uniref:Uncharacterized protein n=1 Tax=Deinococcus xinjiangensis TaxID=457454 RepID=A0ABP9VG22_9DEIO
MTTPILTDSQLAQLKVLATAAALTYHDTTVPEGERVDVAASYAVHGDLRLVAADVLEVACLHAKREVADHPAPVKRMKDGGEEIEFFASASKVEVSAGGWCDRASRLRKEAESKAGLIRSPVAGMRSGANPAPVFTVGRERLP